MTQVYGYVLSSSFLLLLACEGKPDSDPADDTAQDSSPDDTAALGPDQLGFATTAPFTEPLVVVPVSAWWDELIAPVVATCTFSAQEGGYSGGCTPPEAMVGAATWFGDTTGNFVAFAFTDADGDGAWSAGDSIVGMPIYQLIYVLGEPAASAADLGVQAGWNAIDLYSLEMVDHFLAAPLDAIPLSRNLEPVLSLSLGGSVQIETTAATRLAVIFSTPEGGFPVEQGPVVDPWLVSLDGAADDSWTQEVVPGFRSGEGRVGAYEDVDGDGLWGAKDPFVAIPRDAEGDGIAVLWASLPAEDPTLLMRAMLALGISRAGWSAWDTGGGRPPEDLDTLTLSPL